jgi:RimJ/RimL family protein N-acetyltransferase
MILTGSKVSLIPLLSEHVDDFGHYFGEPSLWTWWLRRPPLDRDAMSAEISLALTQKAAGLREPFAIFHRELGHAVGSTSIWSRPQDGNELEIGSTWLGLPFHRTGLNRECKDLLLAHLFETRRCDSVMLQTDELNVRSRRAIENIGAKFYEIRSNDKIVWDGRVRSSAVYHLSREDWLRGRKATSADGL